jgi:hypothetical protein
MMCNLLWIRPLSIVDKALEMLTPKVIWWMSNGCHLGSDKICEHKCSCLESLSPWRKVIYVSVNELWHQNILLMWYTYVSSQESDSKICNAGIASLKDSRYNTREQFLLCFVIQLTPSPSLALGICSQTACYALSFPFHHQQCSNCHLHVSHLKK